MLYNGHTTRRWLYDYRADVPFLCALPVRKLHSGGEAAIHHPASPEQKHRGAGERTEPQAGGAQHTDSGTDSGGGGVRTGV